MMLAQVAIQTFRLSMLMLVTDPCGPVSRHSIFGAQFAWKGRETVEVGRLAHHEKCGWTLSHSLERKISL
jgi:hypothetical protein